jgi:hypothetical protein
MATYSFLDVQAVVAGPGGVANIGQGSGASEEGITIEAAEDKNVMTIGVDGSVQHSLVASTAVKLTVRLLKTSPINNILMTMYNIQTTSSSLHGQNAITVANPHSGDTIQITAAAFSKRPSITYAKEGGMNEWAFDGGQCVTVLGLGI